MKVFSSLFQKVGLFADNKYLFTIVPSRPVSSARASLETRKKGKYMLFFSSRKIVLFSVTICLCLLRAFRIGSERILSREAYDTLKRFATISKISLYTCSSPWTEKRERERNGSNPVVSLWVRPNNQSLNLTGRIEWKTMTHRDWKDGRSELHWMNDIMCRKIF